MFAILVFCRERKSVIGIDHVADRSIADKETIIDLSVISKISSKWLHPLSVGIMYMVFMWA